jgi:hypothetical protein
MCNRSSLVRGPDEVKTYSCKRGEAIRNVGSTKHRGVKAASS